MIRLVVVLLALLLVSTSAPAQDRLAGRWQGTYYCAQGLTGVTLTIRGDDQRAEALFHFYPVAENPSVPVGCYTMLGHVETASGTINLESDESHWILRPSGYVTVNFRGRFAGGRHHIVGRVEGPACSTFILRRVEEAPPAPKECFLELPTVGLPATQARTRRR
ncbi:MAG: hypothetical protein KF889_26120 [Alphaproteobacteria bacterium]|nr:hypothetical protein [Alphaproteobacteria bacterium]MCW5739527.1 hypothetical protein [Alphaproteobacteria bacterium]